MLTVALLGVAAGRNFYDILWAFSIKHYSSEHGFCTDQSVYRHCRVCNHCIINLLYFVMCCSLQCKFKLLFIVISEILW